MAQKYFVYVLRSTRDKVLYVGSTQNIDGRLKRHNQGDYRFTKGHRPWEIVYQEELTSRSKAVKRERYLKSGIGREELNKFR